MAMCISCPSCRNACNEVTNGTIRVYDILKINTQLVLRIDMKAALCFGAG